METERSELPQWLRGKESACNTEDIRDMCLISGSEKFPEGGPATYSNILAWRIPWTEELARL